MDQTTGTTPPPANDKPEQAPPQPPASGDTATPATPPSEPTTPSGPPPVEETSATPPAAEAPTTSPESSTTESSETPSGTQPDPATSNPTPASDTATPAPDAPKNDHEQSSAATPPAPDHDDKKSLSKPLMVVAGLLVIGALSAVFLVSNMQTGDTQSSASTPTSPPALPTEVPVTVSPTMAMDPNLTITEPVQNSIIPTAVMTISGKTFPNADVFVGDKELTADETGMFSTTVTLEEGENSILVVANDEEGNAAEQEIMVTHEME